MLEIRLSWRKNSNLFEFEEFLSCWLIRSSQNRSFWCCQCSKSDLSLQKMKFPLFWRKERTSKQVSSVFEDCFSNRFILSSQNRSFPAFPVQNWVFFFADGESSFLSEEKRLKLFDCEQLFLLWPIRSSQIEASAAFFKFRIASFCSRRKNFLWNQNSPILRSSSTIDLSDHLKTGASSPEHENFPQKQSLSRSDPALNMPFSFLFFRNCYIHLLLFSLLVALVFISASAASNCSRSCGTSKKLVPYPFGFSDGCKIRLNCINGSAFEIGDHLVRNVTPDNIVVDLPAKCNRAIHTIQNLWSTNYALTWKNGFLLSDCNSSDPDCVMPTNLLEQKLGLGNCSRNSKNFSCFSKEGDGLMLYADVNRSGCRFLFSSYALDSSKKPLVSLDFQTVELDWWLEGRCSGATCAPNAVCTNVTSTTSGATGHRCRCADGFEGDGFRDGDGCRKGEVEYSFILFIYLFLGPAWAQHHFVWGPRYPTTTMGTSSELLDQRPISQSTVQAIPMGAKPKPNLGSN